MEDTQFMFRSFFESSADAMLLVDPHACRFLECNEAFARQAGLSSAASLKCVSADDIFPEYQPCGRRSNEKLKEVMALALAKGSHRFEWLTRRMDGSELPLDIVLTAVSLANQSLLFGVSRDISAQRKAEGEILDLNCTLEQRVTSRTSELLRVNQQLREAEQESRRRSEQIQKHRDVLMELAQSDKSDFAQAVEKACRLSASTLEVARVSYWSLAEEDGCITCELLYCRDHGVDASFRGTRVLNGDCPAYFNGLGSKRPIVADDAVTHPATRELAENYLHPLGITSMLDAPVWVRGQVVGVLCHEHIGAPRSWTPEEIDFASAVVMMVSLALEESRLSESQRRLRESEARFSTAFRASPVLITISRMSDSKFVEANDAFVRWFGMAREEILGRSSQELGMWVNAGDRERFLGQLQRSGSVRNLEDQFRSHRGTVHTMQLCADIIEINREPHMLVFGLDVTQRKQAEAELLKALARERELGQLRSNFVSMVSHEFRTPLGIIQSSAEILDGYFDQLTSQEREEHLWSIQKNTRRMAGLMEEVLLIGSFDAGKVDFKPAPLDVGAFAHRLVDEVLSATDNRCPIELALSPISGLAQADERLLRHIFTNLLTNAVKYSHPGQAVRFEISRDRGDVFAIVADLGLGIPAADQDWLFSPFHRGGNVGDRPGTGLGLVIVKRCIDLLGGEIKITSNLGAGTQVMVRLPMFDSGPGETTRFTARRTSGQAMPVASSH